LSIFQICIAAPIRIREYSQQRLPDLEQRLTHLHLPALPAAAEAFNDCENLTTVELPESITGIGSKAFQSCPRLMTINLPKQLTSIGQDGMCHQIRLLDCVSFQFVSLLRPGFVGITSSRLASGVIEGLVA
jgi:hypothetical protein